MLNITGDSLIKLSRNHSQAHALLKIARRARSLCPRSTSLLHVLRTAFPLPQSAAEDMKLKPGDDVLARLNPRPMQVQIDEAERLGLGTKKYELVKVEP